MTIAVGDLLGGRYSLRKIAWEWPQGQVWLARDQVLDRAVLVQMFSPEADANRAAAHAFQKAAARAAQFAHPGLLRIFDIGSPPTFVVFEHATGGRLVDRLQAGPLRPDEAARAALGMARGLEALHERGTWHGALSPETVLFDEEGRAKILATGIAEASDRTAAAVSKAYRPPEPDALPADVDRWALAALTSHMLTGKVPERGVAPAQQRKGVPAPLSALVGRALSADPTRRPSLDEFVGGLAPYARVLPTEARTPKFRRSEFSWLLPVVLIVALATAAATVGVQFARDLARKPTTEVSPSPGASGPALTVADVSDFDPPPGNGEEHPEQVGRTIDGDARTSWATLGYRVASMSPKKGVGLIFDLGAVRAVGSIRIESTLPGWSAEIRVADTLESRADDFRSVTSFTAGSETLVSLRAGTRARYFLVWITQLVNDGSESDFPFRAAVSEVVFPAN